MKSVRKFSFKLLILLGLITAAQFLRAFGEKAELRYHRPPGLGYGAGETGDRKAGTVHIPLRSFPNPILFSIVRRVRAIARSEHGELSDLDSMM